MGRSEERLHYREGTDPRTLSSHFLLWALLGSVVSCSKTSSSLPMGEDAGEPADMSFEDVGVNDDIPRPPEILCEDVPLEEKLPCRFADACGPSSIDTCPSRLASSPPPDQVAVFDANTIMISGKRRRDEGLPCVIYDWSFVVSQEGTAEALVTYFNCCEDELTLAFRGEEDIESDDGIGRWLGLSLGPRRSTACTPPGPLVQEVSLPPASRYDIASVSHWSGSSPDVNAIEVRIPRVASECTPPVECSTNETHVLIEPDFSTDPRRGEAMEAVSKW